jgi:peptide chain release factor 1
MYNRYAERNSWKVEKIELIDSDMGGYSKIIFAIKSKGVYSKLKFEAGAHRVQRIPKTESQGRVHTSIATVAVLPEAEEVDLNIDQNELKVDVYRSSGPGGQSVNTTDSAVRITHIPTGLVVSCQDEKSQLKNKHQAMRILRARLLKARQDEAAAERAKDRKEQVGSGERSDKIRTYNYKDNRVSDHRINLTLKKLDQVLDGDLDDFVDALVADHETTRLANLEE